MSYYPPIGPSIIKFNFKNLLKQDDTIKPNKPIKLNTIKPILLINEKKPVKHTKKLLSVNI